MPSASEWNRLVNSKWPKNISKPTPQEAITGAKRLYRRAMGRPFKGKVVVTSGNRHTWVYSGELRVNPNRKGWGMSGWPEIVHMIAHLVHRRKNPYDRPHSHKELDLEADLTRYAIENGFHEGRLVRKKKAVKPKPSVVETREARLLKRKKDWLTKKKRAETALAKIEKSLKYYQKKKQQDQITYASGLHPTV